MPLSSVLETIATASGKDSDSAEVANEAAVAALGTLVLDQFELPPNERLLAHFQCSLVEYSMLHPGYLYVFEQHLCFVGLLHVHRVCIELAHVSGVQRRSFFGLVDARVEVLHTEHDTVSRSTWFLSLGKCDAILAAITKAWKAIGSSPFS